MRNVSEIVYVESLDCSGLVEKHMPYKSENNDKNFDEEICIINELFLCYRHCILFRDLFITSYYSSESHNYMSLTS